MSVCGGIVSSASYTAPKPKQVGRTSHKNATQADPEKQPHKKLLEGK